MKKIKEPFSCWRVKLYFSNSNSILETDLATGFRKTLERIIIKSHYLILGTVELLQEGMLEGLFKSDSFRRVENQELLQKVQGWVFQNQRNNLGQKKLPLGEAFGNMLSRVLPFFLGIDFTSLRLFSRGMLAISSSVGVPITSKMISIWFFAKSKSSPRSIPC